MTLRHMKIFVTVCECNSITSAAKKLYLAQPSVSLAIKQLEEYYGVKLFDRISRKLYITELGKQFLDYATHIVSLYNEMEKSIKNWDYAGTIRVGSSITIGNYIIPKIVKMFYNTFPHMKVQIAIDNSEAITKRIMNNEIDFGLIEGITDNPQIISEKFMNDKLVLICGNEHPLTNENIISIDMLRNYDFILREKGSAVRELFDSTMITHNIKIEPIGESISTQAIVRAVQSNIGISVLPYLLVRQDIKRNKIKTIAINDISFTRHFYIIYHKNKFLTPSAINFINLCKKEAKNII